MSRRLTGSTLCLPLMLSDWKTTQLTEDIITQVHDSRPQTARPNFTDLSAVEKYVLPSETYESLPNSVLAWKKNQKLGRFDPSALSPEDSMRHQAQKDADELQTRGKISTPC